MRAILISIIILAGCAKSGSSDSSTRALFSAWNDSSTSRIMDLSSGNLTSSFLMTITYLSSGMVCQCIGQISGIDASGNFNMSSCNRTDAGSNTICSGYDGLYNYSKSDISLHLCFIATSDCTDFQ